jgi:hypothetical protein
MLTAVGLPFLPLNETFAACTEFIIYTGQYSTAVSGPSRET